MKKILFTVLVSFMFANFSYSQDAGYDYDYAYKGNNVDIFTKCDYYKSNDCLSDQTCFDSYINYTIYNLNDYRISINYTLSFPGGETRRVNGTVISPSSSTSSSFVTVGKTYKIHPENIGVSVSVTKLNY
jgi:hypothetical protein